MEGTRTLAQMTFLFLPFVRNLALAIVVIIVGLVVIKWVTGKFKTYIEKSPLDNTLKPFSISLVNATLKVLLAVSIIKIIGIDTTSFVAILAAAGFAVGLAFQGSLANFAGGVLLLTIRPFKVGDYIETSGYGGTVEAIQILYTELITVDNKVIYIPNGNLANTSIVNYSVKDTRRVDFKFTAGYNDDQDKVISLLEEIMDNHAQIFKEPKPFVRMSEHADSALVFTVRVWTKAEDYWTVYFDIIETVKRKFDEEGISIPYPQMDVHFNQ
ncbi:small conductance mechanosensitive channel [Desulfonispora thiosulfatigenes DSM 11270]|uniref:Small conductance mechanosensitive channel n=1 Tax=Desulfonispora thiosulfatigenes DSM 11270 TaxID=656914 RepID=A0A1W1UF56_DESTI|nr:mechanosensitive ion channel domain-containing protein [Desulfonispora thiosulfatigenes]SMB79441.1 small conductance mechanosensitive channel [Desulfonispora thiosulfatigenes DSM 11270]